MKALKIVSLITVSVCFFLACSTAEPTNPSTNENTSAQPANTNPSPPGDNATSSSPAMNSNSANAMTDTVAAPPPADDKKNGSNKAPADMKPAAAIDAVALFKTHNCAMCHGTDGKGKLKGAPDWSDPAFQKKMSDATLVRVIREGKPPLMPAYGEELKEEEIKALAAYVRTFAK
ncbi:MAG: c-type cytochrome [Blastocatellia bacterium]|nr:c-type cytochrome [Blastocatellia bacterium]